MFTFSFLATHNFAIDYLNVCHALQCKYREYEISITCTNSINYTNHRGSMQNYLIRKGKA